MRKFYSVIALFAMAIIANAQVISFSETATKGSINGKTFGSDGFVLTVNDAKEEKIEIDANSQFFGTADSYTSYGYRMKTGGKSGSNNSLSLTIPSDGTLTVCVRSASSSDATRNVVFEQDGVEILNQTLNDADAVKTTINEEEKNVFPKYSCEVKAGTVNITYPTNGVNFYAFELVSASGSDQITKVTYGGNVYEVVGEQTLNLLEPSATAYSENTADFSAQLAEMLKLVGLESASASSFVQVDPTGVGFAYNTNDGWHGDDGSIEGKTWGSGAKLVCIKPWNGDTQAIDGTICYIGCIDETWTPGETHTFRCATINDGKAAILNIVLNFFDINKVTYSGATYDIVATKTLELKEKPNTAYSGSTADFSAQLAEMMEAVGLTTISNTQLIQVDDLNNGFAYNANDGWHGGDGSIEGKTWGSGEGLVCVKPWNGDTQAIDGTICYIGCIDETWNEGDVHVCRFAAINDGKAAILAVAITFTSSDEPGRDPEPIADPAMKLSELDVVKEYTYTMTFSEGRTDDQTIEIDMADLADVLGTSEYSITDNTEKILLTQTVVTDDAGSVSFTDDLIVSRFGTDGWFGRYSAYDEATDVETPIVQNAPHSWGSGATFYVQSPKFADGKFSLNVGAYAGTMKAGDADYAELYIVNGTKAAKLTLAVAIKEIEVIDFSNMVKVGEQEIDVNPLEVANAYTSVNASFDIADVLAKLGCDVNDIITYNYGSDDYQTIVDPTINDYWLSETGVSLAWASSPCCQVKADLANGVATLLQMSGKYFEIEEAKTFPMYYILANGSNYYLLKFNFTLKPVAKIEAETECVATELVTKQIIPGNDYPVDGHYQLDQEYIESVIGTSNFTIYGDVYNSTTGKLEFSKDYSCYDTENKGWGFWYGTTEYENEEGQVVVTDEKWGCASTNAFGFQLFPDYSIGFFQFPEQRQVGDAYSANIYLMNEENGKYIKFIVNVKYVEEITPDAETVGTDEVCVLAATPEADGTYKLNIDMTKAYEALGITNEELEAAQIIAPASQFTLFNYEPEEDITFDANGYATQNENRIVAMANLSIESGKPILTIDPMDIDMEAADAKVVIRIGLEINNKRYIHIVTLAGKDVYTAIANVKNTSSVSAIYSITGAKVNAAQKGINIMKMADGSVKKVIVK